MTLPALFDRIPVGFFGPLGGSHATLYWAILGRFYELEYEGEPHFLVRPVAVQVAEDLLRASPLWSERREEWSQLSAELTADGATLSLVFSLADSWFYEDFNDNQTFDPCGSAGPTGLMDACSEGAAWAPLLPFPPDLELGEADAEAQAARGI